LEYQTGSILLEHARVHRKNGEYTKANKIYSEILSANPCDTGALLGVGSIAQKLKSADLAVTFFSKVIEIDKNCDEAFFKRGQVHFVSNNFDLAIADFTSALQINPSNLKALNSRGIVNTHASHFSHALEDFGEAIQICSSNADLFYNRGLVHWNQKNYLAAISDYTCAIELRPEYYQAFNNRGSAYRELANFEMALKDFETSTNLKSDFADGYWNQSLIHLMLGEYEKAWPLYEYRWLSKYFPSEKRHFSVPLWIGNQSIEGKTILIHSEQGLGDTIHFCRYIKLLQKKKCKILMEVEKPLINLMKCLLPPENIFQKGGVLPKFDFHCPLISLPIVFNTSVTSVPFPKSYLTANNRRVAWWKTHLGNTEKPRVGLCWRGNPSHPNDSRRSTSLRDIIGTLKSDFEWVSLQYAIDDEEEKLLKNNKRVRHFGQLIGDFAETAAFCKNLDAVICVDTSIAHLAGSIGLDTYLLLARVADSRWHADGNNTPWYNNVTILRRDSDKNYPELLSQAQKQIWKKTKATS
jgi:tetratricopeptide (TPR) repeat protein